MTYDLIALGETMLSLTPPPGEQLAKADVLMLDQGGAESNTCIGLARLGFRVAWVSRLGTDTAGDRVLEAIRGEGVDTQWVRRDRDRPTGLMLKDPATGKVRYYRAGSAASCISPADLDGVPLAAARGVLVTGITAQIGAQPQAAALKLLESGRGMRAVDVNFRNGLWGSDRRVELVTTLARRCDLLFGGEQELAELVNGHSVEDTASRCAALGAREIVLRGRDSVRVRDDAGDWNELSTPQTESWDPMGAGDAFNAGYLSVRLRGGTIREALLAAVHCGKAVAASPGDSAGFPRTLGE